MDKDNDCCHTGKLFQYTTGLSESVGRCFLFLPDFSPVGFLNTPTCKEE